MFSRLIIAGATAGNTPEFLNWVADFLVNTYHEEPDADYIRLLRGGRCDKDFMNWITYRLIRRHGERMGAEFATAVQQHLKGA
jgi:hypothetical protein